MKYLRNINENNTQQWEVSSAKRPDGVVFNIGDSYEDANGEVYEIKRMYITSNGSVMAEAKEGGTIDLWSVKLSVN